jgi:hypothetical protein
VSIVSDAQDAGLEAQRGVIGLDSAISRGASTFTATIVPGRLTEHPLGFMTRDFLIKRSEYTVGDPAPQDIVSAEGATWEVLPFEDEKAWSRFQGTPNWIRVHTKETGWSRDTLTFEQPRKPTEAGDVKLKYSSLQALTGLVKPVSNSEIFQGDVQQLSFMDLMVVVRSTTATRRITPKDRFSFTWQTCGRNAEVTGVRDPGTNGSVLYLDCRIPA